MYTSIRSAFSMEVKSRRRGRAPLSFLCERKRCDNSPIFCGSGREMVDLTAQSRAVQGESHAPPIFTIFLGSDVLLDDARVVVIDTLSYALL